MLNLSATGNVTLMSFMIEPLVHFPFRLDADLREWVHRTAVFFRISRRPVGSGLAHSASGFETFLGDAD